AAPPGIQNRDTIRGIPVDLEVVHPAEHVVVDPRGRRAGDVDPVRHWRINAILVNTHNGDLGRPSARFTAFKRCNPDLRRQPIAREGSAPPSARGAHRRGAYLRPPARLARSAGGTPAAPPRVRPLASASCPPRSTARWQVLEAAARGHDPMGIFAGRLPGDGI